MGDMGTEGDTKIILTKKVMQQLLEQNQGYTDRTNYEDKNLREQRDYEVRDGELHIRSRGKTSWADSRFDDQFVANEEQTRRFLRRELPNLNTAGLESPAKSTVRPRRGESADPPDPRASSDEGRGVHSDTDLDSVDTEDLDDSSINPWILGGVVVGALALCAGGVWWYRRSKAKKAAQAAAAANSGHANSVEGT